MDVKTEIELEVRIQEQIEKIQAEFEAGRESATPPESLDGTIGASEDTGHGELWRLVFKHALERPGLIVGPELIDDGSSCFVHA